MPMLDKYLRPFYPDIPDFIDEDKEENMTGFQRITEGGRTSYIDGGGRKLTVWSEEEIFQQFKRCRLNGKGDTYVFEKMRTHMAAQQPQDKMHEMWCNHLEKVLESTYEKYSDKLPELAEPQPEPKRKGLFKRGG